MQRPGDPLKNETLRKVWHQVSSMLGELSFGPDTLPQGGLEVFMPDCLLWGVRHMAGEIL